MFHYLPVPDLKLPTNLQQQLEKIDWRKLTITSEANRWQVICRMIKIRKKNWIDFFNFYGWLLGDIGTVKNLRIGAELSDPISKLIQTYFGCRETPILRLQVMFGGKILPLHTDITRHVSLIIPISNHTVAHTNFYKSSQEFSPELPNPRHCQRVETTVLEPDHF